VRRRLLRSLDRLTQQSRGPNYSCRRRGEALRTCTIRCRETWNESGCLHEIGDCGYGCSWSSGCLNALCCWYGFYSYRRSCCRSSTCSWSFESGPCCRSWSCSWSCSWCGCGYGYGSRSCYRCGHCYGSCSSCGCSWYGRPPPCYGSGFCSPYSMRNECGSAPRSCRAARGRPSWTCPWMASGCWCAHFFCCCHDLTCCCGQANASSFCMIAIHHHHHHHQ
jgi:hypothetical protein